MGMVAPGLRVVPVLLAVGAIVAAVIAVRDAAPWGTTYGGASAVAATADLLAGIALLTAGLVVGADQRARRIGVVLLLGALAWHAADIVGWEGTPATFRIPALAASLMLGPLLLDVAVAVPGREPLRGRARWLVVGAYLGAIVLGAATVAGLDPRSDPGCWRLCVSNPFRLQTLPAAPLLDALFLAFEAAVGLAIVAVTAARLRRGPVGARHGLRPVLLGGAVVGLALAARPVVALLTGREGPRDPVSSLLFVTLAIAVAAYGATIVVVTLRERRTRDRVRSLAWTDGTGPRSAMAVIAAATQDHGVRIAYPRPDGDGYVNAQGLPVDMTPSLGRSVTEVRRAGAVVAVIDHDPRLADDLDLADLLGPAVRLALENERLDAELLLRLEELRASLTRIVAAEDQERQRRERDLHDGAQQRLLALAYDLRSARAAAERDGTDETLAHLDAAIAGVHATLHDVRQLAHGIYPAVLVGAGLGAALETLAEESSIVLRLDVPVSTGADMPTELTAYVVIDELVRDAVQRRASMAKVVVWQEADRLVVEVEDDSTIPDAPVIQARDRAGAMGGNLDLRAGDDGASRMHLEIPCVSS
jgi:signal transduction histidine kinase